MRIKLKKGVQKIIILKVKNKLNVTWKDFGKILDISELYLKWDLLKEKRLISEELYKKLCKILNENFDNEIIKKLDDNWGRALGGKNSAKKEKLILNRKSEELAEFIGIILGDGNIWEKRGYYYICIAGDSKKDRDYLINYVNPLFKKLFNKKMNIKKNEKNNTMYLCVGDKSIVFTLKKFGLVSGNKKINNVKIPDWIFESKSYLKACIRGLIDTDGSVCPITGRNYPYIWFSSNIENIRKTFSLAMEKLKFKTSKWNIRENRTPDIYIGNKKDIKKYIETISFKNQRHLSKLNAPIVQRPNSVLE